MTRCASISRRIFRLCMCTHDVLYHLLAGMRPSRSEKIENLGRGEFRTRVRRGVSSYAASERFIGRTDRARHPHDAMQWCARGRGRAFYVRVLEMAWNGKETISIDRSLLTALNH